MSDWTAGYVADIAYTFGYYSELNPLRVKLAFLNAGIAFPEIGVACELGFGQGLSANLHAAASVTSWFGTDFNPAQAGFAQELAAVAGSGAQLFDEAFADFSSRPDLPQFDYIGLHGIWSWISDENRAVIVNFIRRQLKVGGVLYISYNTQPGWAAMVPMRHLLNEHAEAMAAPGSGIVSRIDAAIDFAEKLLATNPTYARANPQVAERIQHIKGQNRHYLAHEYFNRDWHPMHFADMADWLAPTKLSYACSAYYLDHVNALNLNAEQQTFLQDIPDAMFRETVRDFMTNQQFRRDYWVKGARRLAPLERTEQLRALRVILITPYRSVSLTAAGALGEANMNEAIYRPVLETLADHQPKTLGQIEQMLKPQGIPLNLIVEAMLVLCGKGDVQGVQDEQTISQAKARTDKLNAHLLSKARSSGDISHLASPVTGGGVIVPQIQQLFLLARSQGKTQPAEWAAFVWQILAAQGQKVVHEGRTLDSAEENIAVLTSQAQEFAAQRLPILQALQIA